MRERLEAARRKGTPFRIAFRYALRNIRYAADSRIQGEWKRVLKETADEWERAYLGEPAKHPGGIPALAAMVGDLEGELNAGPVKLAA
jgi:hypothetical protein